MRQFLSGFIKFGCLFLISCGPGKELLNTRAKADSLGTVVSQLGTQVSQLNSQVDQLNKTVASDGKQIGELKQENVSLANQASDCNEAKLETVRKLSELNAVLKAQGTSLREIRQKAETALSQLDSAGVEVEYKNGLVYIEMQDQLLFKPGSAKLGKDGARALGVVAQVLNDNPNLKIYVIGNTDSIKVTKGFTDNWSLSTERANTVVRVLRDQYQVSMDRVVSAGKGKYDPIADNSTEDGRTKNRRTDIILNPDLSRLWNLIDNQQ